MLRNNILSGMPRAFDTPAARAAQAERVVGWAGPGYERPIALCSPKGTPFALSKVEGRMPNHEPRT